MSSKAPQSPGAVRAKLEFPVWYRSFAKSYSAWANAPADLKAPLLLQGAALAKAETWLLACPEKLTESQKRFIVRSISQRSREPASAVGSTPAGRRQATWRRSSDRSLWSLYAVIALGMWVFAPDILRDLMERTLNPPEAYRVLRTPQVALAPAPATVRQQPEGAARGNSPAQQPPIATTDAEITAPLGDIDETPPLTFPARPPLSRAMRMAELAREQLDAGRSRVALLLGIEAAEEALARSTAEPKAAEAATATLSRALATREMLGPLAAASASARTTMFCHEARALIGITGDETASVWPAGALRRSAAHPLGTMTLEGAGADRDCRRLALPNADHNLEIRTLSGGRAPLQLIGHEATILATSFSRDGTTLVTASQDGTARVWDARSGRQRALLSGHDWHVVGAELTADASVALTASSDNTARLWDAATGKTLHVLRGHQGVVTSARFVDGEKRVLTTSWDGTARLWDARTGGTLRVLRHANGILLAEASPDGGRYATTDANGGLMIWGASAEPLHTVDGAGPAENIRLLRFMPDGRQLALLSWSGRLALHSAETGALLSVLTQEAQRVRDFAIGPGGRTVLAVAEDGERLSWPIVVSPREAVEQAKAAVGACLTADERSGLGLDRGPPAWCATLKPREASLR